MAGDFSGLADDFYRELRQGFIEAAENPGRCSQREGDFRRYNMKRFPYNFLFRDKRDHIRILVVRHHARDPRYGTGRE